LVVNSFVIEEMSIVPEAVSNIFRPDKINYELLGNGCPHIHWHLYTRVKGDTILLHFSKVNKKIVEMLYVFCFFVP